MNQTLYNFESDWGQYEGTLTEEDMLAHGGDILADCHTIPQLEEMLRRVNNDIGHYEAAELNWSRERPMREMAYAFKRRVEDAIADRTRTGDS